MREIQLNVVALVRLTHAAAAEMVPRGEGGILNVSSLAGFQPGPMNAIYSATKAFVTSFTEAVHEELKGTGVAVTVLCPGFTRTGFQDVGERAGASERARVHVAGGRRGRASPASTRSRRTGRSRSRARSTRCSARSRSSRRTRSRRRIGGAVVKRTAN